MRPLLQNRETGRILVDKKQRAPDGLTHDHVAAHAFLECVVVLFNSMKSRPTPKHGRYRKMLVG